MSIFGQRMQPVLQTTASECGLVCLTMVAQYHGSFYELSEVRAKFALSLRGMTMASMVQVAASMNLLCRPLKLEIENIGRLNCPAVLHWDMNHFVVLVKVAKNRITIYDPANGEVRLNRNQFAEHFTGVALELSPAPEFKRKPPEPPLAWRDLLGSVVGLKRSALQLILIAAALQILSLFFPWVMQWVIDGAIVSGDHDLLNLIVAGFVLLIVVQEVFIIGRRWSGLVLSTQINLQWSNRVMAHLLRLPAPYFETRHIGDIVQRFQSLGAIQNTVTGAMVDAILDGVFATVTLILLFVYSTFLGFFILLALVLYALIRWISYRTLRQAEGEYLVLSSRSQSYFLESVRGYQSIKISGTEDIRRLRWFNQFTAATNRLIKTEKLNNVFGSTYSLIFGIEGALVLWVGATQVIHNEMSVGMLMAFMAYKDQFSARSKALIDRCTDLRLLDLHLERLSDIVMTPVEPTAASSPQLLDQDIQIIAKPARIELVNVGFRYGGGERWIVRHINLTIEPSEHVALIGPSGCGKSTIAKLIIGLLLPQEGDILIDGISMQRYGIANWRKRLGVVMQDDQLFSGSLQSNIANFSETINTTQVQDVARLAHIHEDIEKMPMRYQTYMGDMGNSLSGGQKQRVMLARALYCQPSVLVLDEATSHLDVDNEIAVGQAISQLSMTRIVIAHRPQTIAMAQKVIDMQALLYASKAL
jgi:ATP-binding cassette, subfamily B, bacterial CvaB/MchF/RaxB